MQKRKNKDVPGQKTIQKVFESLSELYPDPQTELTYEGPFQLLAAVILSAQCTDQRVNLVTPSLFKKYPDAKSLSKAKQEDIEKLIHSCGFYRQKAKSLIKMSGDIIEKFNGRVPSTLEELITLRGVGRKTASVVLNQAFSEPAIAVDTHVKRVAKRLGWTNEEDPVKIETDLKELLPIHLWSEVNGLLILHGRRICKARRPQCEECEVQKYCRFYNNTKV